MISVIEIDTTIPIKANTFTFHGADSLEPQPYYINKMTSEKNKHSPIESERNHQFKQFFFFAITALLAKRLSPSAFESEYSPDYHATNPIELDTKISTFPERRRRNYSVLAKVTWTEV